ncbi:hypothetical protein [Nocardioides sp. Root140]|uniref:hypothetical protein n=1 Tax=Nocardioides sp. Root140 TaxID=1736460 RepID=UPI0006FF5DED|nr:hypothetical protein [Nocardioides sp. Root140]KQY62393.1 hypothetical protein ASD30_23750 [Nocardioides sp. Root140]
MNLSEVYRARGEDSEAGAQARLLLDQQHWFASIAEFDPRTGDALPLGFDDVVHRIANRPESTEIRDRLWRIIDHCRLSIEHIFAALSENPRREQAYLPIRDVKELNATSFIALSRRPGRNIREKLAGKPYMQAVRRYQSVDLPQNRLVKEFVTRLADLLELRMRYLDHEDDLLGDIHRWLRTDEAQAIGRWDNLPPNNTLLSHRDYRRVWHAWRWLQVLDDTIERDFSQLDARAVTVTTWDTFGKAYSEAKTLFGDMPVLFDYDSFAIEPWREPVLRVAESTSRPDRSRAAVNSPVCVDLTYLRPRFATIGSQAPSTSPETYLWQRWRSGNDSVDLELFRADIALLDPDATSLSVADLFFSQDADPSQLDSAAHAFARKLSKTFTAPALLWLVPDFLNDFQLQVARRNINARFAKAEPLPRSVAAVFDQIDHAKIKSAGFQVVVVDQTGGTTYATKLIARYDADLLERVPQTRGFYWERSPHVTLQHDSTGYDALAEIPRVDRDGNWNDQTSMIGLQRVSEEALRRHPQVGKFDVCITIPESPVRGGVRLHELQLRTGDIPLWRDHIPELSIKVFKDRRYEPFFLVDRDTTIRPVRGVAVPIPVPERFTLPAGKAYYQFPLFQGQEPDDLGYVARLESPVFPLAADVTCRLTVTYTYGADDPYRVVFEPIDGSFKPVQVKWRPKTEEIITDAPAPGYPCPLTWAELQHHYYAQKDRWNDYLDWVTSATTRLLDDIENPTVTESRRLSGRMERDWMEDRNGKHFTFAGGVFLHETALRDGLRSSDLSKGDLLYYDLTESADGRPAARNVSIHPTTTRQRKPVDAGRIRVGLYVPYIKAWGDSRSLSDPDCPSSFRTLITTLVPRLDRAMRAGSTPIEVQREIRFLLCCMHRDMPESVSRDLAAGTTASLLDERAYAFALGDLSDDWQYNVFLEIWNRADAQMLSILAQAIWRTESFVRVFDQEALEWLGENLLAAMRQANSAKRPGKGDISRLTQYCELLLGLLRSRDSDLPVVRLIFQPHQELTKNFAEQVELSTALIERSGHEIRSRVEIADLPKKAEGDSTPDLLYALRLFLTGDVGAYAIRVTGVNDGEDD